MTMGAAASLRDPSAPIKREPGGSDLLRRLDGKWVRFQPTLTGKFGTRVRGLQIGVRRYARRQRRLAHSDAEELSGRVPGRRRPRTTRIPVRTYRAPAGPGGGPLADQAALAPESAADDLFPEGKLLSEHRTRPWLRHRASSRGMREGGFPVGRPRLREPTRAHAGGWARTALSF